jgi:DNA-directed RNA polymerase subunit alpha
VIEFLKPNVKFEKTEGDDRYGKFVMEPLQRGYGTTIGNSLRRIMLSSMAGSCVSNVRIDGVLHEFSAIDGVRDDVTDIVMNLKNITVRSLVDEPVHLKLEANGSGNVTAGNIEANSNIEVIDPEQYIAEITDDNTTLSMELVVEKGVGYEMAQRNTKGEYPLNTIFLDCHYTPIKKVNYSVDAARVGQDINYDRLELEVWTDGSVEPEEAVKLSATMLRSHLDLFIEYDHQARWQEEEFRMITEEKPVENKCFDIPIKELEFSVRSLNCLQQENIRTLGELAQKNAADLLVIKNFGKKSLYEIRDKLAQYGLTLKDEEGGSE